MQEFLPILEGCSLFQSIASQDIPGLLSCLGAKVTAYPKNQTIFSEGEPAKYIGIVLSGSVQISKVDLFGNRSILAQIGPGELFAESYACADVPALPVNAIAVENSTIMHIDCHRITVSCPNACGFHNQMIFNLLRVVAKKNLAFHQKIEVTSKRTTREKLMTYLLAQAKLHNSRAFTIPFDRQGLADYLEVERSAMSAEISKLRKDGIIECEKSHFKLLQ